MKVLALVLGLGLFAFVGVAVAGAKHNHHDAKALIGDKLKTDGTHQIHKVGEHTVHAEVKGGKLVAIHVKHPKKGDVKVTKYKSSKKMALLEGNASDELPAQTDGGVVSVGFGFIIDDNTQQQEIYWTPASVVADIGGAVDYQANP